MFELSKDGAQKATKGTKELYLKDLAESIKSCVPGEWVYLKNSRKANYYLAFVNPLAINARVAHILKESEILSEIDKDILFQLIELSVNKRAFFKGYRDCSRLVYGSADSLPGLIVDSYSNAILIQINTAGIDRFRDEIKKFFEIKSPNKKILLLDNEKYRERENLPVFEKETLQTDLELVENELQFRISSDTVQKVGYYYDHRENRRRSGQLIQLMDKNYKKGLDLFSYVGSWGMHFLQAGLENVEFVDQGNMEENVLTNLKLNGFESQGSFVRNNVFDFIKRVKKEGRKYDLICSDPPAFCKSRKEERKAYEGYLKLHKSIFELLDRDSLFIACSCTFYVDLDSFQKNIEEAAFAKNRKIQLLDCGVQAFDHPITNLSNKSTYLKYFAYKVE